MKDKILLIKPRNTISGDFRFPPLGLISMASSLEKKGGIVRVIDANIEEDYIEKIKTEIKDSLIVGITILTAEIKNAIEICRVIKSEKKIPIVIGGWHATLFPKQTCEDELVDFVVMGEGEETMAELVKEIKKKKPAFNRIKGLVYKKDKKVVINPLREKINLEKLPESRYDFVNIEKYIEQPLLYKNRRVLPYESSRGCPYHCAFCINAVANNSLYRKKSAGKVLDEIEGLIKKYNLNFITFIDDNFFVDTSRVREICRGMIKRKLKINWFAECRADYIKEGRVDKEILILAKKAGLSFLTIGIESGDERILKRIKKDITVEDAKRSAEILNEVGITPQYSFIVGFPGESKEQIYKTIKLTQTLRKICPSMIGGIGTFRPYPKCELCEELVKRGKFKEPEKFREWAEDRIIKIYTDINYPEEWQTDQKYIRDATFFVKLTLLLGQDEIKRKIKQGNIKYIFYSLFRKMADARIKSNFFSFPIDRKIYQLLEGMTKRLKS